MFTFHITLYVNGTFSDCGLVLNKNLTGFIIDPSHMIKNTVVNRLANYLIK